MSAADDAAKPPAGRTRAPRVALLSIVALQLALTSWFLPPSAVFSSTPLSGGDYDTHAEQSYRALEGLSSWGKSWVYDVHLLAGFPNGTIFDADNKAWELWTFSLHALGVPRGLAFNLFALLAFCLLPLSIAAAARTFGLCATAASWAALLCSCLWFFDSLVHWLFFVGTISFLFASYLCVLALALYARWLRERRARVLLVLTPLLAAIHLVHPYAFFVLAPAMLLGLWRARPQLGLPQYAQLGALCAGVLAANFYWLANALAHAHYVLDSGYMMAASVPQLAYDFFELLEDPSNTGLLANRTAFRLLAFGAGAVGLLSLRRERHPAFLLLAGALASLLALAYLGGQLPPLRQIQPYRFVLPAMFFATLPAGHLLSVVVRRATWAGLGAPARGFAVVASLLVAQHLAGNALYFFPRALPAVRPWLDGTPVPLTATGFGPHHDYRVAPEDPRMRELAAFFDAHRGDGRIAVQASALGEAMAARTDAEILGGFLFCNVQHSRANLFRRLVEETLSDAALQTHLEAYAVRYLVLSAPLPRLEGAHALFEPAFVVGGQRILRTKLTPRLIADGPGLVRAATNRIAVTGADPTREVVLRYHFHEALRCRPDCRVTRANNPTGGVAFIRIPAPHPAAFVVENGYGSW